MDVGLLAIPRRQRHRVAVEINGLNVEGRKCRDGAWIEPRPIDAGSGKMLYSFIVGARRKAKAPVLFRAAIEAQRRLLDWQGKLRSDELQEAAALRRDGPDLAACRGGTLDDTRHVANLNSNGDRGDAPPPPSAFRHRHQMAKSLLTFSSSSTCVFSAVSHICSTVIASRLAEKGFARPAYGRINHPLKQHRV